MLRDALFIARADLKDMLRRRETLLWTFLMPPLFFYFIGTVTAGFGRPRGETPDPIALRLTERNTGFIVDALVSRLEAQHYAVTRATTDEALQAAPRRLRFVLPDAGAQVPDAGAQAPDVAQAFRPASSFPTLTDAVLAGRQVSVEAELGDDQLRSNYDRVRIARAVYGLVADIAVSKVEGIPPSAESLQEVAARPRSITLAVSLAGRRITPPTGFAQAVPGISVMFTMLVLLTTGAILLVVEREAGLLRRLASTPIAPASVVLGKWLARMGLGLVQIAFGVTLGTVVFKMDWGAALPMVAVVLVAWAAFNASLSLLLGNLARSANQMAGLGVLATMILAALGGCWWPIEIAPAWMQALAMGLPTGWCMDALHKIVSFGDPASRAVPHVAGLAAAALAAGWAGVRTFRYQ